VQSQLSDSGRDLPKGVVRFAEHFFEFCVAFVENAVGNRWDSISEALPAPMMACLPEKNASLGWYAIQTRYRFERKVTEALDRTGVETFIPLLSETHCWSDRKKIVQTPLFSGYTFVRLSPSPALQRVILQTTGVTGFVSSGNELMPIPPSQLENLRKVLSQELPCKLAPFLNVGRRVRVRGGCLDGLEGILIENDARHLIVSIESIQRSLAIEIAGYQVELV
jgi:transcription antitermination factor NusG